MFKHIAGAAVLLIASSAALAGAPGVDAGVDAGTTRLSEDASRDTCYGGFADYHQHPNLAAELGYRRLFAGSHDKPDQYSLSLLGSYPLNERFDLHDRLGYNRIDVRDNPDVSGRALYGVGIGYAFTPATSGRVEVQKPMSDIANLSAGVVFKF